MMRCAADFSPDRSLSRSPLGRTRWLAALVALALPLALGACATVGVQEQGNSVDAILGPVDLNDEMAPVDKSHDEPADEPAPAAPVANATPKPDASTQSITSEGMDADPGVTTEVSAPPKRPSLPALELFGSGGRGGPG